MIRLILKLAIPLTIISFAAFTKWWYALPVDATDTLYYGFPFPFVCNGWHTSMSLQLFIAPLIADFFVYLLFWLILIISINHFVVKIKPSKLMTFGLWVISVFVVCAAGFVAADSNNLFYFKRPYDIKIMDTGYRFVWEPPESPDYYKYHPKN